jgi:hypothetical protein
MKILMLSYFDINYGSKILLKIPGDIADADLYKVTKLIELYDKEFFQHWFGKFKSANMVFEIKHGKLPRTTDLFLVSLLIDSGTFNISIVKKVLEKFIREFSKNSKINDAIYGQNKDLMEKIKTWFYQFYESLPEDIYSPEDTVLNAIPDMLFQLSGDGTFLDFKPGVDLTPIIPPSEFIGKTIFEILPPEIAEITHKKIKQALTSKKVQIIMYSLPMNGVLTNFEARLVLVGENRILALVRTIKENK